MVWEPQGLVSDLAVGVFGTRPLAGTRVDEQPSVELLG